MGGQEGILIGWATTDITPDRPAQLMGQYYERISQGVRDPISATALALERGGEQAVIVSRDLVGISEALQERVRALLAPRLPGPDPRKLCLAATHIHTGPVFKDGGWYPTPPPGVMTGAECLEFLAGRLADVVQEAWNARRPGGVSWALGRAAVGHNRRVAYDDGTVQMYGSTDTPRFVGMEGGEDQGVESLFTWDGAGEIAGVAINVACPSQVVEHLYLFSADYWGEVRKQLRARRSPELFVLPLCGAAGDQSPRDLVRSHHRTKADVLQHSGHGLRIKARSKALQTFIVQLACGSGGYLPTARAVPGGGYSAGVEDGEVGPEGGQTLVEGTLEIISGMWEGSGP